MLFLSGLIAFVGLTSMIWWLVLLVTQRGNLHRILEAVFPARQHVQSGWRFADALVTFGSMQVVAAIVVAVLRQRGLAIVPAGDLELTPAQTHQNFVSLLSATLAGQIIASAGVIAWAKLRESNRWASLGLDFHPSDVVDGIKATVLLLPPVLMISGLVNQIVPYEHVVLDSMKSMKSIGELTLVFVTTALVTPFVEEFIFRVLLISGLERIAEHLRPAMASDVELSTNSGLQDRPIWPIFISSFLFAILHLGQGAAPIPLFFLALGLAIVYRRTRRIWPVMIVHMGLNSLTLIATMLQNTP